MISKNEIRRIKQLNRKKGRREEGAFIVEGVKGVEEVISSDLEVQRVFATDEWSTQHSEATERISEQEMKQISALSSPSPALAVVSLPPSAELNVADLVSQRVLVLDQISDPGNLGTMIRTADWFGISTILIADDTVDQFNPKVIQATMGSLFRVNIHRGDLPQMLGALRSSNPDYPIYAADMKGESVERLGEHQFGALIIGSEAHGISKELKAVSSTTIAIPGSGSAESLNASIATGILLYAWTN